LISTWAARVEERVRAGGAGLLGLARWTLVCACIVLAAQRTGIEIVTVEGAVVGERRRAYFPCSKTRRHSDDGCVQCGLLAPLRMAGSWATVEDPPGRVPQPTEDESGSVEAGNLFHLASPLSAVHRVFRRFSMRQDGGKAS
jgi:hypothetical protein